jgi:cytochrome b6-f complex iron-sulfur subunit/menaquinol-cytochrome c reductase iron-sulfur subunit
MSDAKRREEGRRSLLRVLVGSGSAVFACALAAPAAVFVAAPATREGATGERWVKTIRLEGLREGEPKKVAIVADERDAWTLTKDVELGAVWLFLSGGKVVALSSICPHLGCSVNANPDGNGFACPCHTSTFDAAGHKTGGPAPRDMDPLETRVEAGFVLVDFRRYRMSIAERVEIG